MRYGILLILWLLCSPATALQTSTCDERVQTGLRQDRGEALRLWQRGREFLRQGKAEIASERFEKAVTTVYFRNACQIPGHPARQQALDAIEDLALARLASSHYQLTLDTLSVLFRVQSPPSMRALQIKLRADFHLYHAEDMLSVLEQLQFLYTGADPRLIERWQSLQMELEQFPVDHNWLQQLKNTEQPEDSEDLSMRGYLHWQLRMPAMAGYYWHAALQSDPGHTSQHWLALFQYRELLK